ncbi:LysR family transcriptional regulator [Sphingobium boeckii]|uniref:DNA-binding transcriptional LysR family regulator n=1 Tax=Sphingobium boeckii TaxID=1082345 RepID=A0A7W9EEM3_9SPHN|nr:LysR family transcriptional regulator [Sphingobium boeckii]MBB5686403.1 DNA-binding transcriptional LysR family regulator [Sphingobium boeckii]
MNITKLERMIAVAECGSFRKASLQLGMSQPALTWSIRQLEESLNTRLFDRGPRGIRTTPMCERLIVRAKLIVSEQARFVAEVEQNNREQEIEVGVHPIMLTGDFARCAAQFSEISPDIRLRIREGYSSNLLEMLQRGELDFAYCGFPEAIADNENFEFEQVSVQDYSVVARPDHPVFEELADGRAIGPHIWAQFDAQNIVAGNRNSDEISMLLEKAGYSEKSKTVRSSSMSLIKLLVQEGGLLGLIADEFIADELATGKLGRIPGTQIQAAPIGFVSLSGSYENPAARRFKSMLRQLRRSGRNAPSRI